MGEIKKRRPLVNGRRRVMRVMTDAEVKERAELNAANTASAIRKRVLEENAKSNGGLDGTL